MKNYKVVVWEEYVDDNGYPTSKLFTRYMDEKKLNWYKERQQNVGDVQIHSFEEVK